MREILLICVLLGNITGFCQNTEVSVLHNERQVGTNLPDGSGIYCQEYVFPEDIYEAFYDHSTGYMTLRLRGLSQDLRWNNTGTILQYNLEKDKSLWSKPTYYDRDKFHFYNNTIINNTGKKTYYLDVHTGAESWEIKNDLFFVDPIHNIGIGYKYVGSLANSYDLQGIDLKTGNVIWERHLYHEYGWNEFFYLNDSTLAVVAAGLNTVNIHTGKGWHVNKTTTKKDHSGTIAANAAGIATGFFTGTFFIFTGHDLISDLVSNTVEDSSHLYLATYEELTKINKQSGEIAWNYLFTHDLTSKSSIFIHGNTIYMVNLGMAYVGSNQIDLGQQFFAGFEKETGRQKFQSMIRTTNNTILDYEVRGNEIYFLFKYRIMKFSLETGEKIADQVFPPEYVGEFEYFIGDHVYVETEDGYFMRLRETNTQDLFISTKNEKTVAIDKQFNVTHDIKNKFLNLNYLETDDFKFISKGNNTLIIDNEGEAVAEVQASTNAFLIDYTLFDTKDNRLIAIDLSEILIME